MSTDCLECKDVPIRMADGRAFTDYRSRAAVNTVVTNSYQNRMDMVSNATEIMKKNMMGAYEMTRAGPGMKAPPIPKPAAKQTCNANTCTFEPLDTYGGLGLYTSQ
jgi:hypothetical protein